MEAGSLAVVEKRNREIQAATMATMHPLEQYAADICKLIQGSEELLIIFPYGPFVVMLNHNPQSPIRIIKAPVLLFSRSLRAASSVRPLTQEASRRAHAQVQMYRSRARCAVSHVLAKVKPILAHSPTTIYPNPLNP